MKKIRNHTCQLFLVCLFCLSSFQLNADEKTNLQQMNVVFSKLTLTLQEALDEMNALPEISVVYGNIDKYLKLKITFSATKLSIAKAIQEIELGVPVDIVFNDNHIIVKSRKLENGYQLSGRVIDASTQQGLVAASVIIEGTTTGVVTDNDGNFSMRIAPGTYRLLVRYVGYQTKTVSVNLFQDSKLNIQLEVKENQLQSVDVTGSFSVIENIETGRTIETIDSKVIDRLNTNDVNDALHGRINGVWNTKISGAPGDHHKIRIRGISSIFGSTDPLYVVDGAIIPIVNFENLGISDLNAHDIESITVLKDASSTALYGNLGGNGVILIETKKGGGATSYNFKVKQGIQRFDKRYNLMGAEDFLNTLELSDKLIHTKFYTVVPKAQPPKYELYPRYLDSLGNALDERNYQDELFQLGSISEYQISGSGEQKGVDYYVSANIYNHNGIIVNTNYKKYTVTANLSKVVKDKYSLRFLYKGSHQENKNTLDNYLGNNMILHGINYEPAYVATPDSFLAKADRLFYNSDASLSIVELSNHKLSPDSLFYANNKNKLDDVNTLNFQGYFKINNTFSMRNISSFSYRQLTFISNNSPRSSRVKQYLKSRENYSYFNTQFDLNYSKQIKYHQLSAFVRYRGYWDNVHWMVDSVQNVAYDGIKPEDGVFLRGSQALYAEQGLVRRSIHSAMFNLNYNYKKKYFISVLSNLEGLREGTNIRNTALFSSMAFNYNLVQEKILKLPKWVNSLNLYLNWGNAGNYPLNSLSDDLFSINTVYAANDDVVRGAYISNLANRKLRPEAVRESNLGLKGELLKSRLNFSVDFYRKTNDDLLIKRTIPLYYGGGFFFQNIGAMRNSGYEISLEAIPFESENLYWSSTFGISGNNQYITKLDDGVPIAFNDTDVLMPDFYARENEALGAITGYKYIGKWKDYYDPEYKNKNPLYVEGTGLAYARNDTTMSYRVLEGDKQVIGNSIPDFTFHWINDFEYKNFSVNMIWYGVVGVDKYNATKASTFIAGVNSEVRNMVLDTMKYNTSNTFYESSYFVEDASFIRLKTLSFSYRQPKKAAAKVAWEYTISFENLLTLTRYSGYDPEAAIYTNNNFSDNAIDRGAYPNPKGVYFSINLNF